METLKELCTLMELMPQAAMIVDIKSQCSRFSNRAAKDVFAIGNQATTQEVASIMTHAPSTAAIYTAVRKELQTKGKSVLHHISMKTRSHAAEHYDVHISYVDDTRDAVYLIFALSAHELQRMAQQNTYYDTISEAAYSYPFHLDVKTRRMEFFDPALESEFHMSMVMENFPEPVFTYNYICEDDVEDYLAVVDRMYKGLPPQGSFRFYTLKGELLRYSVNYVVHRDETGEPMEVIGDFIIQSETKIDPEASALSGVDQGQKVVLAHQIKAHFFFNTLNTISALCKQDAAKADSAIRTFATYMRSYMYLINESDMIPFEQEMTLVKSTLEIEKLRFPNSFTYTLDLEEEDFHLPPLSLQPIVENALLHGLRRTGHHGTLNIRTRRQDETIFVTITDDGLGFDVQVLKKTKSIGLKNLIRRIEMTAGGTVTIHSALNHGTEVVIAIPDCPDLEGVVAPIQVEPRQIVYVDDEPTAVENFQATVEDCPAFEGVSVFSNPQQLLTYGATHPIDVAFLDIDLPWMSGFTLAEKLQAMHPNVTVAFITGNVRYMHKENQPLKAPYIFKPYSKEDLLAVLGSD